MEIYFFIYQVVFMSEINLEAACQLFETQVTLQYQNRLKLQDTRVSRYAHEKFRPS
jgi:hypothetical protein